MAKELPRRGYDVVLLDDHIRSFMQRDIQINSLIGNVDWVLHFAGSTSIELSLKNPFYTYSNNVESTLAALETTFSSGCPFLFMSSYVYGQPRYSPIDEKHPVKPSNPYMGSKIIGEEICRHFGEMLKIPLVILRGFNIYGDYVIPGRLISDLIESVRNNTPLVLNDPLPRRDYLYIKDFLSLVLKILMKDPAESGTYNVGFGCSYSNVEVAEMVRKLAGGKLPIIIKSNPRTCDISDCNVDITLVKKTFSWIPEYTLENGLSDIISGNPLR